VPSYITPRFPLMWNSDDGKYLQYTSSDLKKIISQNMKNILMTIPGEYIFDSLFGVGVEKYLFLQFREFESEIRANIYEQFHKYAPYITIEDVLLSENEDTLFLKIRYIIDETGDVATYNLTVGTNGTTEVTDEL